MQLDGLGAFDNIRREAMLRKLMEVSPSKVPFVRQFYGRPSAFYWTDDAGVTHTIDQAEDVRDEAPRMMKHPATTS